MAKLVIGTDETGGVMANYYIVPQPGPGPSPEPSGLTTLYIDQNNILQKTNVLPSFEGAEDVGDNVLSQAFSGSHIEGDIVFEIPIISGEKACYQMFYNCSGITSARVAATYIYGSEAIRGMFQNCTNLTELDLSELALIAGNCGAQNIASGCSSLESINIDGLESITGNSGFMDFAPNSAISEITFTSLSYIPASRAVQGIGWNMFNLTDIYFPSLFEDSFGDEYLDQFSFIATGRTELRIHFPWTLEGCSYLENQLGYPNFGGTDTEILFDLPSPARIIDEGNCQYLRKPWKDTGSAYAWGQRFEAFAETFYTELSPEDLQPGDGIYSDPEFSFQISYITTCEPSELPENA